MYNMLFKALRYSASPKMLQRNKAVSLEKTQKYLACYSLLNKICRFRIVNYFNAKVQIYIQKLIFHLFKLL